MKRILITLIVLKFSILFCEETNRMEPWFFKIDYGFTFPDVRFQASGVLLEPSFTQNALSLSLPTFFAYDFANHLITANISGAIKYEVFNITTGYFYGYNSYFDNYYFNQGFNIGGGIIGEHKAQLIYFKGDIKKNNDKKPISLDLANVKVSSDIYDDLINIINLLCDVKIGKAINTNSFFYQGNLSIIGKFFRESLIVRGIIGYIEQDTDIKPEFYLPYYVKGVQSGDMKGTKLGSLQIEYRYYPFEFLSIPFLGNVHLYVFLCTGGIVPADKTLSSFKLRFSGGIGGGFSLGKSLFQLGTIIDDNGNVGFQYYSYFE